MTPSAVSKLVSRLEQRLAVRLFNRSTRQLQLTPEGCTFYEHSLQVLADLAEAEQNVSAGALPQRRVRININVPMRRRFMLPLVTALKTQYPDIVMMDTVVDLLEDLTDMELAHLAAFQVDPHIAAGRLTSVLEHFQIDRFVDVHAVYLGHRGTLPARIRPFLIF